MSIISKPRTASLTITALNPAPGGGRTAKVVVWAEAVVVVVGRGVGSGATVA